MARQKTGYWQFALGQYADVGPGAAGSTPLEKPLLPYRNGGTGRTFSFSLRSEPPYYAAPNLIVVGLGGLQQGQLASPGPLYSNPGQTYVDANATLT